jgi:hypothetical protein
MYGYVHLFNTSIIKNDVEVLALIVESSMVFHACEECIDFRGFNTTLVPLTNACELREVRYRSMV